MSMSKEDFAVCNIEYLKKALVEFVRDNVMTPRQKSVHEAYYDGERSQSSIAEDFKLSQPTVSRHLKSADEVVDKYVKAVSYAISKSRGEDEYKRILTAEAEADRIKMMNMKVQEEKERLEKEMKRKIAESMTVEELQQLLDEV